MKTCRWHRVLLWLLPVKLVYLAGVYAALRLWPAMDERMFHGPTDRWLRDGAPVFASHFTTYDAAHYLNLSEVGYGKDMPECAFYPLWPLLIRGASNFTAGSHLIAGLVLANVFSLAAWLIFHRIVAKRFGEIVAKWALAFLILFPGSLFYQFIYSEPVFFLLVMLLWMGLEKEQHGMAWVAVFLLPLARGVGVFCGLPIGWHLLMRFPPAWVQRAIGPWRWSERMFWPERLAPEQSRVRENSRCATAGAYSLLTEQRRHKGWACLLLVAPLAGWAAYLALMWHWTGNPLEGIQAQKHWRVHSISNLWNVPKIVIGLFNPNTWHAFTGSLLDRCLFILLLYTLPVQWRLGKDLLVWSYVLGILPAMSGTFTSFTRYASCAFPMFIALAVFLSKPERRWLAWGLVIVFSALHLVLVWRFVNFRWAG
jgi:hypothetical protein